LHHIDSLLLNLAEVSGVVNMTVRFLCEQAFDDVQNVDDLPDMHLVRLRVLHTQVFGNLKLAEHHQFDQTNSETLVVFLALLHA